MVAALSSARAQEPGSVCPDSIEAPTVGESEIVAPKQRPKVGLVLSGGGAKGLAHIGVLKAIDRSGLHIDYIAGTSMGAILGAMYACGYSGEQIERISLSTDWMKLINSKPLFSDINIEDKEEFENYTIRIPMKGLSPQFATGFFEPYHVMQRLKEVFFPVYKVDDFSQLNIPFRCVAADLGSGDAVVFKGGDLAFATRSSMAIPGVFSATEYGDTKLVDGGIIRNFPVRDVLDMGADYVIGVNLFSGLTPPDELTNIVGVMMQITNFRDAKDLEEEKAICDMLIEPDVTRYSAASFAAADTILAIGDTIGMEFEPLFKQLADSLHNAFGLPYENPERMAVYDSKVRIFGFEFEGIEKTSAKLLRHSLNLHAGMTYGPADFTEAVKSAMSSGYYNDVNYDLVPVNKETNDVIFKCKVKENPLASLGVGLSYNTFSNASIFLNYRLKSLFKHISVTDIKVALSKNFRFRLRNRTQFGIKSNHWLDAEYSFDKFSIPCYRDYGSMDNSYAYARNNFMLSVGHSYSQTCDMRYALGWEDYNVQRNSRPEADVRGHVRNFYASMRRRVNTLNQKYLATSGIRFESEAYLGVLPNHSLKSGQLTDSALFASFDKENFVARLSARLEMHQPVTDRFSLSEVLAMSTAYGGKSFVHKTALGGTAQFLPCHFDFYGLMTAHRYESSIAMLRLSAQYNLVSDVHLLFHLNSAVTFDGIECYAKEKMPFEPKEFIHGGGLSLAYNLLGALPMDFTLMYSPDDRFNVSVNIGYYF